jgi:hypothetical protein
MRECPLGSGLRGEDVHLGVDAEEEMFTWDVNAEERMTTWRGRLIVGLATVNAL